MIGRNHRSEANEMKITNIQKQDIEDGKVYLHIFT